MAACSTSPTIIEPASIPKIDRVHLAPVEIEFYDKDDSPELWVKGLVDSLYQCSINNKALADYILLMEKKID